MCVYSPALSPAVLPSEAHAKIVFRLVAGQSPDRVFAMLEEHIKAVAPKLAPGIAVRIFRGGPGAPAYKVDRDSLGFSLVKDVLTDVFGEEPQLGRAGGSVNAYADFVDILKLNSVSFGFGMTDSYQHAPDERFRVESLHLGQVAYLKMMASASEKYGASGEAHSEL